MAGQGMKNYNWCAKDGNVWYKDCERCRLHYYGDCDFRFKTHPDAVQKADMIRIGKGAPLFSKDFDAMRKSLQQGERTKKANLYGRGGIKRFYNEKEKEQRKGVDADANDNCLKIPLLMFGSLLSAIVLAPILQILVAFAGYFFDIIGFFIGVGEPGDSWTTKTEDFFFYATFKEAYLYGIVLIWSVLVWMIDNAAGWLLVLRYAVTILFFIAAICLPHLFISTIFGPIFIIFGLAYRAKR